MVGGGRGPACTRQSFGVRLAALLDASGLTQEQAAERAKRRRGAAGVQPKISGRLISSWKRGAHLPSEHAAMVLVRVLIERARQRGVRPDEVMADLLAEEAWQRWWQEAGATPPAHAGAVHGPPAPEPAGDARPAGRPVGELTNPYALEVHRAIHIETADGGPELPELPIYVERPHDRLLRGIVQDAVNGSSRIVALVGGSSTGKTRACWEAVQALPAPWRLWHPIDPGRPEALLAGLDGVGPRTVVWLNEAQHYLLAPGGGLGERVAAKLRTLLDDGRRGPVLVLGTVWPEYWTTLTTPPDAGSVDAHPQARALVTGHALTVPEVFSPRALADLRTVAAVDPRLADASAHAPQGHIAQYLAGAPALVDRYDNAPPASRALIQAAMDARRLGHGSRLPQPLLEAAAPGYLTDPQWDQAPADWLEQAVEYTTHRLYGASGPLTRMRARPGDEAPTEPSYRLADYLEQHARTHRGFQVPPASFWDAAIRHTTRAGDLLALAAAAHRRWRLRHAARLYLRADGVGHPDALWWLGSLTHEIGDGEGAERLLRRAADRGHPDALRSLARMVKKAGDLEGARRLSLRAAQTGYPDSIARPPQISETKRGTEAAFAYRPADAGHPNTLGQRAWVLDREGDLDAAEELYLRAADAGHPTALRDLARMRERVGELEVAERRYLQAADAGHPTALRDLGWMRQAVGDLEDAERRYLQAAEAGHAAALCDLAWMRAGTGDREGAQRLALQAIDAGEPAGVWVLAETHRDDNWWKQLTRYGLEPDGSISRPWTLDELPNGG
ncbi:hypothetical protein SAVIM338S_00166 [Streptomyces avidinii]